MVVKKIKPMFNRILTTMNRYKDDVVDDFGLIKSSQTQGTLKEYQTVVEVGPSVTTIKVGDIVCIDPVRYAAPQHRHKDSVAGVMKDEVVTKYNFPQVDIDGVPHMLLFDSDVTFVVVDHDGE